MYKIYCCTDIENGYKYIGLTETSVNLRLQRHYEEAMRNKSNSPFKQAIRNGRKFRTEILIDNIQTPEEAAILEKDFINKLRTYIGFKDCKGYNGTRGGEVVPSNLRKTNCIMQYDLDGTFIRYFNSISNAAESINVSRPALTAVLKGDGITCGGYQWRFINDDRPVNIVKDGMDNIRKSVIQYDLEGNYIDTFCSLQEAADAVNTDSSSISKVCRGIHHSHKGYVWKYSDDTSEVKSISESRKTNSDRKRSIVQFTLDGILLNIFDSAEEAYLCTGVSVGSIRRACKDIKYTAGNYRWAFANNNIGNNANKKIKHKRKIAQYTLGGQLINIFESMIEASKQTGVERTSIYRCCNNKSKTGSGYIWKYID